MKPRKSLWVAGKKGAPEMRYVYGHAPQPTEGQRPYVTGHAPVKDYSKPLTGPQIEKLHKGPLTIPKGMKVLIDPKTGRRIIVPDDFH